MFDWSARAKICHYARELSRSGYVVATEGNLSLRIDEGEILITKTQVDKGRLRWRDLVKINLHDSSTGRPIASSESPMHLKIYRTYPEVRAIIHTHPPFATALAVTGVTIKEPFLPEMVLTEPVIPLVPYAPPSSWELAELVVRCLGKGRTAILQNHGLVTVGVNLREAFWRTARCEQMCKIYFISKLLGGVQPLSPEEVQRLKTLFPVSNLSN